MLIDTINLCPVKRKKKQTSFIICHITVQTVFIKLFMNSGLVVTLLELMFNMHNIWPIAKEFNCSCVLVVISGVVCRQLCNTIRVPFKWADR